MLPVRRTPDIGARKTVLIYNVGRKLPLGNSKKTKGTIWNNMRRAYGEKLESADSVWIEITVPTAEDTIVVRYGYDF